MSRPDGYDLVRMKCEEQHIQEGYEQIAAILRSRGVPVPDSYTEAEICKLARDHGLR